MSNGTPLVGQPPDEVIVSSVQEADAYTRSVMGIDIDAIRTGRGSSRSTLVGVQHPQFTLNASTIGFPMMSRTVIRPGQIVVASIICAPPGSRWCNLDLQSGMVLAYGSEAKHNAVNQPGLRFTFLIVEEAALRALADKLKLQYQGPGQGKVYNLTSAPAQAVMDSQGVLADASTTTSSSLGPLSAEMLCATTAALCGAGRAPCIGGEGRIDSRRLVHECIDYAESAQRIPSVVELCQVAHVSERRLRTAFTDEYGVAPKKFFRAWALNKVRRRLLRAQLGEATVTELAVEIGFGHLGRFAGYYKRAFGETPSATLRSPCGPGPDSGQLTLSRLVEDSRVIGLAKQPKDDAYARVGSVNPYGPADVMHRGGRCGDRNQPGWSSASDAHVDQVRSGVLP